MNREKHELRPPQEEKETHIEGAISKIKRTKEKLLEIKNDPVIYEGIEPSLRALINTAIAVIDTVPIAGEVVSWGSDVAKIWARKKYKTERARVEAEGGDVDSVKLSNLDLTPDVSVEIAVITEIIEPFAGGFFPSHAIEGGIQLVSDWPKIKAAAIRLKEIYQGRQAIGQDVIDAGNIFDVEFTEIK